MAAAAPAALIAAADAMPLDERQIERYSRQIILPEIGGRGQERLLAAVVVLAGDGDLLATAARYLAGAGIGTLRCADASAARLGDALRALNPEITIDTGDLDAATTAVVAAGLALGPLDGWARRARAAGVPLVVAATRGAAGWLFAGSGDACAGCAARTAAAAPVAVDASPLDAVAAGVLGAWLASTAIDRALGQDASPTPLRWFDAATATFDPLPLLRVAGCGGCADQRGSATSMRTPNT